MLLAAFIISSPVFSVSKKKKKTKDAEPVKVEAEAVEKTDENLDDTSYSIKLPSGKNQREYFAKINPEVLKGVQNGSPDSLRDAMALMRQRCLKHYLLLQGPEEGLQENLHFLCLNQKLPALQN